MEIPPLAGLATYEEAARVGYSVEENVKRFLRYAWIEKRAMEVGLFWLASTPEWEVKEALGLHLSLDADHAADIRVRVSEMRNPMPRMDVSPDPAIDQFFDELLTAQDTVEKIVGLYGVLKPALLAAYRTHYAKANPVIDHPTRRMIKHILIEEEEMVEWGDAAVTAVTQSPAAQAKADQFQAHLNAYLRYMGGIMGGGEKLADLPPSRVTEPFTPDFFPQRDDRFAMKWNFVNPQRQVSMNEDVPLDERTLALMCRRIVEMDVPEYMTRIVAQVEDEPWEYFIEMTRQLWDEVRHASMGTIYFESRGVDWKKHIAIHPGMSIRLGTLETKEAHNVLYAIEQNLMPAKTGKRLEYEISVNANDPLAAQIQDYDWADEVLHVHTGRKWLLPKTELPSGEAVKKGWETRASTVDVLAAYEDRGEQKNWWPEFVQEVLGHKTAHEEFDLVRM
ncbi:hypothetical protein [Candidatus Leptofilum sp.]|uniref:hypothetical protein n=1 Tax=Candidatus Leptofilum sp. TaxID=3241576 RepID=UPI003B5CEE76